MTDQLSVKNWLDQGLKTLARDGFTALKADPLESLLHQAFGGRLVLEKAVRTWATLDPLARGAVQAIDRRRLGYVESLFKASGLPDDVARARAQIIYWAFLGFALSDKPLPPARQAEVLDELLRIAAR